jgi:hypothetical protein
MANVQNIVELLFKVSDQATAPVKAIENSVTQLKTSSVGLTTALGTVSVAAAAVGAGIVYAAKQAIELGSKFEDTSINIAGNIRAFDLAPTFDAATKSAANALDTIEAMAAKLPGETDQYIEVFKIALPKAIESGMNDIKAITDLTSRFTAVAVSGGIDAAQAGMNLSKMLAGQAGADVNAFTMLAPHLKMTAAQFNKLTIEARRLAIDKSLGNFKEMMEAAGNTFSSKMGEAQSHIKTFVRLAGQPIFEEAVKALSAFNQYFSDNEKMLKEMGKTVTIGLVDGIRTTVGLMRDMYSIGKDVAGVFSTIYDRGAFFFDMLANALPTLKLISGGKAAVSAAQRMYAQKHEEMERARRVEDIGKMNKGVAELSQILSDVTFGKYTKLGDILYTEGKDAAIAALKAVGASYSTLSDQGKLAFAAIAKNVGVAVESVAKMSTGKLAAKPTLPGGPKKADVVIENARFDIKQNFAEGYDPDRIAAAFVDQLGAATMYRTQSAFSGQPGTG